jgi:hypothetical protein
LFKYLFSDGTRILCILKHVFSEIYKCRSSTVLKVHKVPVRVLYSVWVIGILVAVRPVGVLEKPWHTLLERIHHRCRDITGKNFTGICQRYFYSLVQISYTSTSNVIPCISQDYCAFLQVYLYCASTF